MNRLQQSILIGSILGDGWIDAPSKGGSRWIIKYDDKYLPYLNWLYLKLRPLGLCEMKTKRGNYHQHYFSTKTSLEIAVWRKLFYPKGKKIIPNSIKKLLIDPISLAVWYMDDETLDNRSKNHFNASIATYCFSYVECLLLASTLMKNFKVEAKVHKCTMRGKTYYRLYIKSKSMSKFINLISKYIQPCMAYKINRSYYQQLR